jgi:CSLREA domain-containing protein
MRMRLRASVVGVAAMVVLGGVLAGCGPRPDLVVTKTADTNDGACNADCSLREAVVAANAAPGPDVIRVQGFHALTRRGPGEDASATGDLDVRGDLVLEGSESVGATISGSPTTDFRSNDRVLDVHSGTVEVRSIELANGEVLGGGGVVRSNGTLTLVDAQVRNGRADNDGGGIVSGSTSSTASLTLVRTTVAFNRNTEEGAGVRSRGRLRIEDSTIQHNTGGPGFGMGVHNGGPGEILNSTIEFNGTRESGGENCGGGVANTGTLAIRNSRITNNGGESGGGILNSFNGVLTVVGTQVRYNRSSGSGGGVANNGGRVLLDASTVAGNEGDYDSPRLAGDCPSGEFDEGGGLWNSADGTFELRSTTVAFNESALGAGNGNDCAGTFVDRGGNTIGDRVGCDLRPPT